jgi:nucleoside-diphosphate-sugar epimerase
LEPGGLSGLNALPEMDVMVSALSGTGLKDPARYRELYVEGPVRVAERLRWSGGAKVYLLGSTGVYGEDDGELITEDSPATPLHRNGEVQLEAEAAVRGAVDACCVLRLSGLYGPGRTRLIRQALRKRPWFKPEVWANQVQVEDVAGVIDFLIGEDRMPELLLVSDDRPALREEIFTWIRQATGYAEGVLDEDHPERAGRNRGNKRVSNQRLRETGYCFRYPDYQAGLMPLLADAVTEVLSG